MVTELFVSLFRLQSLKNGKKERAPDIRLGVVILQDHTTFTDYQSTHFQLFWPLDVMVLPPAGFWIKAVQIHKQTQYLKRACTTAEGACFKF
jgi:hypothetical protein